MKSFFFLLGVRNLSQGNIFGVNKLSKLYARNYKLWVM